jgi:hypothetical protein
MRALLFAAALIAGLLPALFINTAAQAQTAAASFVYPTNGATNIDTTNPFQWTTISNATAYYLYVGTTQGGKDLINTGEIQATSYYALGLPTGQTLYGRIWTKISGVWYYNDITFVVTNSLNYSQLSYPKNGATGLNSQLTFTWNPVANAQAYYLYVGTTMGANDLVNTGQTQNTNWYFAGLPASSTLYARIWTRINNAWFYSDSTFTTGQSYSGFQYPRDGATNVKSQVTFQWTAVSLAQTYYLYVGTTKGSNNLINTGEIQTTSYSFGGLPANQTLYARIYTKVNNNWYYNDVTFSTGASYAAFTYPRDGAGGMRTVINFQWTSIANAQAYYLYVGTTRGAKDLVDTGEITTTSRYVEGLPTGITIYARIWTKMNGNWYFNDISFKTGPQDYAAFIYPQGGATAVDCTQSFQWTSISNVQAYYLYVGTTLGGNDLINSGEIHTTSLRVAGLPTGQTLYGRIYTKINGAWLYNDISFMVSKSLPCASFTYPLNGETDVKISTPFSWNPLSYAQSYYVKLGSSPGASDLYISGTTQGSELYYIGYDIYPELPRHQWIYGTLYSQIDGVWYHSSIQFQMNNTPAVSASDQVSTSLQMVSQVRAMADANNYPYSGTLLYDYVASQGKPYAMCLEYAAVLNLLLYDNNVGNTRVLRIAFDPNTYDDHALVQLYNQNQQSWMLLDPTFTLTATRASDGLYATAEDIQNAVLNFDWSAINFDFLGSNGSTPANSYYIDYPLLYLNFCTATSPCSSGLGNSPFPYMQRFLLPFTGPRNVFAIAQQGGGSCVATVNGTDTTYACNGIGYLSPAFYATSVAMSPNNPTPIEAYELNRYVFPMK